MAKDKKKEDRLLDLPADSPLMKAEIWALRFVANIEYVAALEQLIERTVENEDELREAKKEGKKPSSSALLQKKILDSTWKMLTKLNDYKC
tara:strand:- start:108 stop:380 length:273 start_codon:yes stop_codon:yes gene_type:complete